MVGHWKCLWVHRPKIDLVSLHSGSDLLKHTTKGFSVYHFLNQQLVLGIDIHQQGDFAGYTFLIILFLTESYLNTQCEPGSLNLPPTILEYSMQARVLKFTTNNTALIALTTCFHG